MDLDKKTLFFQLVEFVLILILIFAPIHYFIFKPFIVKGESMDPNFSDGDYLIIDEISLKLRQVERGEILIFHYPKNPTESYIKRAIGLPGDTVEVKEGKIFVNGNKLNEAYLREGIITGPEMKITLKEKEFFVLGDNRNASYDSRMWGILPKANIIGRAALRLWPVKTATVFAAPVYNH